MVNGCRWWILAKFLDDTKFSNSHESRYTDSLEGQADRAELRRLQESSSLANQTLQAVDKILASDTLRLVRDNARKFLKYVVVMKLLDKKDAIKESTIAVHAFDERADYDPRLTGKVRAAAGGLRVSSKTTMPAKVGGIPPDLHSGGYLCSRDP